MRLAICLIVFTLAACGVRTKTLMEANDEARSYPAHNHRVCLLAGNLPEEMHARKIGQITASKRSYGNEENLMTPIANAARAIGADAVTNLQAEQRFKGPLPWRVTAPTGDGIAVKFGADAPPLDCAAAGGRLY
jgi:hypothetical protein